MITNAKKQQIEREGIQLLFAKNQALPRVDLIATYAGAGLAYAPDAAYHQAWVNDYPNWSVGVQIEIPIGRNLAGEADITAAQLRRKNAILELDGLLVQISNDIRVTWSNLSGATERWALLHDVATREQKQVLLERDRFSAGRGSVREIILREERAISADLALLEQHIAYAKAYLIFEAAQGTVMNRFQK